MPKQRKYPEVVERWLSPAELAKGGGTYAVPPLYKKTHVTKPKRAKQKRDTSN